MVTGVGLALHWKLKLCARTLAVLGAVVATPSLRSARINFGILCFLLNMVSKPQHTSIQTSDLDSRSHATQVHLSFAFTCYKRRILADRRRLKHSGSQQASTHLRRHPHLQTQMFIRRTMTEHIILAITSGRPPTVVKSSRSKLDLLSVRYNGKFIASLVQSFSMGVAISRKKKLVRLIPVHLSKAPRPIRELVQ